MRANLKSNGFVALLSDIFFDFLSTSLTLFMKFFIALKIFIVKLVCPVHSVTIIARNYKKLIVQMIVSFV